MKRTSLLNVRVGVYSFEWGYENGGRWMLLTGPRGRDGRRPATDAEIALAELIDDLKDTAVEFLETIDDLHEEVERS